MRKYASNLHLISCSSPHPSFDMSFGREEREKREKRERREREKRERREREKREREKREEKEEEEKLVFTELTSYRVEESVL